MEIEKNKAIISFLGSIVHELKTPLVGIKGFSSMINSQIEKYALLHEEEEKKTKSR